ncbi:ABC transporter [Verticillium alfalfae VaMs.102]|uniref:ABC transporter n=2 Tax=Verticillium TaxID=1036719 RepID=C9SWW2_VERA1|nr:ABC transporter [Verticillium alfalfae VaMs.102]EEY23503.1 ABC transporter [Verticillium alfalfae VaMs.102]
MYRVSPFTYIVAGMLSVAVANTNVICADNELLSIVPPSGESCSEYLGPWMEQFGGYLTDATINSTSECQMCTMDKTNTFLNSLNIDYADRWRNFGIGWAFIIFNIFAALGLYWLARVPKKGGLFGKKKQE